MMDARDEFLSQYAASLGDIALPDCIAEQYELLSRLKDGERGVFLLRSRAGGWRAVLKTQPSGRCDSLRGEYELLLQLKHPQLPHPLAYMERDGREYLLREYIDGVSLAELVEASGPLDARRTAGIAASLCRVLEALHSAEPPVIHRDIKPGNVVLDKSGRCCLIDLGTARRHSPDKAGDTVFIGTEATAPPEQFGFRQTDVRSDIYGAGMLLRFLSTGSLEPIPRSAAPGWLRRIERRCTAFDPARRYSSAAKLMRALKLGAARTATIAAAAALALCAALAAILPGGERCVETDSQQLRAALCAELGLSDGEAIPLSRLGEVEQLILCGKDTGMTYREHSEEYDGVHDMYAVGREYGDVGDDELEIIAQCENLRILVLDFQRITDISPLAGLPLERLSLTGNRIRDASPIASCEGLVSLDLGQNPIRSAEPLAELHELRELTLDASEISSLEPLAGSALEYVSLRSVDVDDLSPLVSCGQLRTLIIGELSPGAEETLGRLVQLEELRCYSTPGLNLALLTDMTNLRRADFFGSSGLENLEALAELPRLVYLNVGDTGLNDVSPFRDFPALSELELREDPLTDLTPLLDCPYLTTLVLSGNRAALAAEQLGNAEFAVELN